MSKANKIERLRVLQNEGYSRRAAAATVGVNESSVRGYEAQGLIPKWCSVPEEVSVVDIEGTEDKELEVLCESSDVHIANLAKRLRTAQRTNTQLRKAINGTIDQTDHFEEMVKAVKRASRKVTLHKVREYQFKDEVLLQAHAEKATAEILFSDFQIGKVGQYYNSELAIKSLKKYGTKVMGELTSGDYDYERIVFAMLGDTVEDHLKHGVQSATSTDSGLAEQMANAIEYLWKYVIQPLGSLGIPMDVVCIAGNHGSSSHKGMDMYKAGLYSYDYPIYKALEGYCEAAGWKHVKFIIPEGVFAYTEIYGRTTVYEHGYFNSCTEKSLTEQKAKRSQQLKRHVEYFRCGDMHHVCDYNNGQDVVNGAFFGVDYEGVEYSGILGFNSIPAQKFMVHTREDSIGRNTIKRNINIQVADGY